MAFVGVDIGTSFIKGAVLDADALSMSHIRRVPFPDPLPGLPPLYREFDPQAVLSAVQQLLADLLPHAAGCEGIVMCSQMHGLIFATERGEPRSNLTTWQDQRVLEPHPTGEGTYLNVLRQRLNPEQVRQLGNELRPGQPLGLLFWLAERGQLPREGAIPASLPDFVLANLCSAAPSTEVTNAAAHGALDLETLDWHREVLSLLGVSGLVWPVIRRHGEVVGWLPAGSGTIPCYTPVGDYQCAITGALLQFGELSLNISTGSQVSLLVPRAEFGSYQTRPFFDGRYLATITHIPAGRALNALVNLLSELAEAQGLSLADPWPYITRQAAEAGGTEMRVNLAFFDSSCGDRGEITRIQESELTVGHLFRAAFQNMADNYYACALQLSPKQAWDNLVLSGGLAQIGLLCQLIAYKFGKGYRLCPTSEDTLLGLLALALAFTRRAASVGEAMSMLLEAHGGQDARQHPG
jgi:sugar (pentulose or hexulose) kinase